MREPYRFLALGFFLLSLTLFASSNKLTITEIQRTSAQSLWKKVRTLNFDFDSQKKTPPLSNGAALKLISKLFDFYASLDYLDEFEAKSQIHILDFITQVSSTLESATPENERTHFKTKLKELFIAKLKKIRIVKSLLYHIHNQGFGPDSAGYYLAFSSIGYTNVAHHFDAVLNWQWQESEADDFDDDDENKRVAEDQKIKAPPEPFCPKNKKKFFHKNLKVVSQGDLRAIVAILEAFDDFNMVNEFEAMSSFVGHNLTRAGLLGDEFDQQELRGVISMVKKFRKKHHVPKHASVAEGCLFLLKNLGTQS